MPVLNLKECIDTRAALDEAQRKDAGSFEQEHTDKFYTDLFEGIRKLGRGRERISLRDLFEGTVENGAEWLRANKNKRGVCLREAQAIDTSGSRNIVGQIALSEQLDALDTPEFCWQQLVQTRGATSKFQEIIPGVSRMGNVAQKVGEGKSYPRVGVSQEWVLAPEAAKHGFIVEATMEMIREDKTGLFIERIRAGAQDLGIGLEREVLNTALGITTSYVRNGAAAVGTYLDSTTNHVFDNLLASTPLTSYKDIEAALALFDDIVDPNTGEPVLTTGSLQLVVPRQLWQTALNILMATGVQIGQYPTSGAATNHVTIALNPANNTARGVNIELVTGAYVATCITAGSGAGATTWFIGDFKGAFGYREYFPVETVEMAPGDTDFDRDVPVGYKFRRAGAPYVKEPRKVVKVTA